MCGIAGLITKKNTEESLLRYESSLMGNAIAHRGPDDSGIWVDEEKGIALAHKRLSIVDLTHAGHQPMQSYTGRYVLTFNGEIYNHKDLRKNLERQQKVHKNWKGQSDTETLITAIEEWGLIKTLNSCVGMFAFAVLDRKENVIHLARDRFGEKPLYWGLINRYNDELKTFVFGSELSAIWALPGVRKSINESALFSYFQKGYIPSPESIQFGINQLKPGHYLSIPVNYSESDIHHKSKEVRWWDPEERSYALAESPSNEGKNDKNDIIDRLEEVLELSINEKSQSEVPLGTFLSGGIDSSIVAALLQKNSNKSINTFTISFPEFSTNAASYNEGPYAELVAKYLGTNHTDIALTSKDAQLLIPKIGSIYSEPFADSSQVPTFLVCREARNSGLTVALTGDGGDELFGGYNRHLISPDLNRYFGKVPYSIRLLISKTITLSSSQKYGLSFNKMQKLKSAILASSSIEKIYSVLTTFWEDPSITILKNNQLAAQKTLETLPKAFSKAEQIMLADLISYLPFDILVKVDRASMGVSLETRAPFLDHRVAELAWSMPIQMKISRNGIYKKSKWALRQILQKYIPQDIINRPKSGFAMPIGIWLRGPLRTWAEDLLSPSLIRNQGFIKEEYVTQIWQEHLTGSTDNTSKIWSILMWQAWLDAWT